MAQQFERVKPGELITANLMNTIFDKLKSLDSRVTLLETSGPGDNTVVITGFSFTEPLHVGDVLTIVGRNFSVPADNNIVTVGGVRVPFFRFGSSDSQLTFDVPNVAGLDPNGSSVNVVVTNPKGTDSDTVTLRPALLIPQGRVEVLYNIAPVLPFGDPNIRAGSYIFGFSVTAFVDQDATYTLTPTIDGSGVWSAQLLEDGSDQPRASDQITIPGNIAGVQRNIRVRATVPNQPDGTTGTLTLAVTENTTGTMVTPGNDQIDITIGSPPPTPETRVRVTLRLADAGAQIVGDKVQFTRDSPGRVQFTILFTEGGTYQVAAVMRNATGWSTAEIDLPTFNVTPPAAGSTTNQNINVIFTAGATGTDTDLVFMVTRGADISVRCVQGVTAV